ncbi:MAG: SRPBCC family protein [Solirubrobacterales bacterium]|nr:SRPBCC family protein [Solirubrobacterales bacterium]
MTDRPLVIEVPPGEPAVVFRRLVDASPDLMFAVWTEPEHLRHWWGPRQFELVVCESDPRTGGRYRFVQRAPDGQEHTFHGVYREVDRPHRLVRTFVYAGSPADESVETVTFQREGAGTLITSQSVFPSFAAREFYAKAGMDAGLRESHDRLDEWLQAIETNRRQA